MESDSYGQMLGWWGADGLAIKNDFGPLWRALHRGETSDSERVQIRCFDGAVKTILCSASPLKKLDGRITGAVILVRDLSEKELIEEELARRVANLISLGVELEASR